MSNDEQRLNHADYPEYPSKLAGGCTDKRERLYVRTTSNGARVWFCHDCGSGGTLTRNYQRTPSETVTFVQNCIKSPTGIAYEKRLRLPFDFSKQLPIVAKAWLHKYKITKEEIDIFGFGWSEALCRLVLPVYEDDKLIYWQGRTFKGIHKTTNPKYLNIRQSGAKNVFFRRYVGNALCPINNNNPLSDIQYKTLVLVEDILSAVKVGRHVDSLALLGSYLPPSLVSILITYTKIIIWLDEDKYATSVKAAIKFSQQLGISIQVVKTQLDPKECSDEVIREKVGLLCG